MSLVVERGALKLIEAGGIPEGVARYLEALGITQASQRDTITVRPPDETEVAFFKLPGDGRVPVIEIRRTGFDESGRPLGFTVTAYPADRNRFVLSTTNPTAATHDGQTAGVHGHCLSGRSKQVRSVDYQSYRRDPRCQRRRPCFHLIRSRRLTPG